MNSGKINILMTGGGAPGAAGIIRCLREEKNFHITVADANEEVIGKYLGDDFVQIPFATDANFIPSILTIAKQKNIHCILPLVTKELLPLAESKTKFEQENIKLLLSEKEPLTIANNKAQLYQFLQWRDIAVPDFRVVDSVELLKTAVQELGFPAKQVCIKPSEANGSRGFRIITNELDELDLFFQQKPNTTYIRYEKLLEIFTGHALPELLVSEYLPGDEYSVDCLANQGKAILVIPRLRKKMVNGISVAGEIIKEENIIQYCTTIVSELKLHGNIGIQVKKSAAGKFLILEINPRVQGTIAANLGAGINLPVLAIKQEFGWDIAEKEVQVKWGTGFLRYWNDYFTS
ncbi:MAG TPA: ATP-grasp domain-containing protein [Chitinophagaceae bacterium]|nr:ATP-grasp domain-containing protein [Chitinophagaceae bacterium]